MPRVVPSQVVAALDRLFRGVQNNNDFVAHKGLSNHLAALVDLVDRVPDELLKLGVEDFTNLRLSVAAIRYQIEEWRIRDSMFGAIGRLPHPLVIIRACLAKCPDEAPSADTVGLEFVQPEDLRASIRLDISAANSDLITGEWKGATVLAGSAMEALLLWKLQEYEQQSPGTRQVAVAALRSSNTLNQNPPANIEDWTLHQFTEVSAHLGISNPRPPPRPAKRGTFVT